MGLDEKISKHTNNHGGKVNKDRQEIQYYFLKMINENITTRKICNRALLHMADAYDEFDAQIANQINQEQSYQSGSEIMPNASDFRPR